MSDPEVPARIAAHRTDLDVRFLAAVCKAAGPVAVRRVGEALGLDTSVRGKLESGRGKLGMTSVSRTRPAATVSPSPPCAAGATRRSARAPRLGG
jgi:hypothetical protein